MKTRRFVRAGALALPLLGPVSASAQDVTIDHQAVECIVVGTFPKMNACFAPVSGIGKARVYFRPETLTTWFYVEMGADASCHSGVLPKPTRALVDKKIFYYVDVQGTGTARTPEYSPVVVAREQDCKTLPAAPVAATGPVGVYPSLPAGFASGGLSAAVVAGGVAAVAVTTGVLVLPGDDGTPGATVPVTNPPVTSPPATGPPTTIPPVTVPPALQPLVVACEATPRNGEAPLRVQFATFPSGGTGTYEFLWSFGDGEFSPNPNPPHTFLTDGLFNSTVRVISGDQTATCTRPITVGPLPPSPSPGASPSPSPSPTSFKLQVHLVGSGAGVVTSVPAGINCPSDCEETYAPGTVVTLTATPAGSPPSAFDRWTGHCTGSGPCVVTMDSNRNVVAHFERAWTLTVQAGANSDVAGSVTSTPPGITCSWAPLAPCSDTGAFINGTTVTLTVATSGLTVLWGGACLGTTGTVCNVAMNADTLVTIDTRILFHGSARKPATPLALSSHLDVPEAEGQVVANGRIASGTGPGMTEMAVDSRPGANRVEAVLVRGAGRPGTWRFDFSRQAGFTPGSLRVVAGTVSVITGNTVIFRLQGKPGERVAFTFEVDP